jgi:uncharacterized protein YukE
MLKISQDFLGMANRLRSKTGEFDDRVEQVMEHWKDAVGAEFRERHLVPISSVLRRLMLTLQEAADTAHQCDRALRDEDR